MSRNQNLPIPAPRQPGRRNSAREERRDRIVGAARDLLTEGDGSFSMPGLAARANVSLATLYNHFDSKADILSAVVERDSVAMRQRIVALDLRNPVAALMATASDIAAIMENRRGFYRALRRNLASLGPEATDLVFPASGKMLEPVVDRLIAQAPPQSWIFSANAVAHHLSIAILGLSRLWLTSEWPAGRLEKELRQAFAITALGLLGEDERAAIASLL